MEETSKMYIFKEISKIHLFLKNMVEEQKNYKNKKGLHVFMENFWLMFLAFPRYFFKFLEQFLKIRTIWQQ